MKVAIIGAGPAGLACALTLERHGIAPAVFEARTKSGELFPHVAGFLQLMSRPLPDQVLHLRRQFHLPVVPLNTIKRIDMHTPNVSRSITGRLGYFFQRGQDENAVESVFSAHLRTPVFYNRHADWRALARHYDYVVVADGQPATARTLGCWQNLLQTWVRGAIVLGNFDPHTLIMWLNTKYARHTYAYLTPASNRRASLVLILNDATRDEIEHRWQLFWEIEKFSYHMVQHFSLEHNSGFVYPHQVGNVLLAGNAGGFIEPFLGFGMLAALRSGVYAGRAIAEGRSYEELVHDLHQEIIEALAIRQTMNAFTNEDYDRLVAALTLPGIKQLIYNTNLDLLPLTGQALDHLQALQQKIKAWRDNHATCNSRNN
ncbi:NAD(P)/FAD-dependent oxidoreductase [Desulfotomaculum copahuensis]|uniref:Dehydrogenase n=1 Tax=Desulfotomaculum copahuensis TaxID=1838280 RepID=A0A1B7LDU0_9FIRM|nr:NAD(P)/FAD-dependent oxidoreductase [Desulfotomaculum copahuensis]OAT81276.1 dehydrogenase [Desulfotomaculum copahuensis]